MAVPSQDAIKQRGYHAIQQYLEDRGITELMVKQLGIEIHTLRAFKERHGEKYEGPNLAILFPHYDLDGSMLQDWSCGVQFVMPTQFNMEAKIRRERWGVSGRGSCVWFNPLCDWRTPPEGGMDIDIHESVLKAALAQQLTGRHSIGLNGVNTGAPKGQLDEGLAELLHSDTVRRVRLIFDDNVTTNPNVARAQDQLAGLIQERDIEVWVHNVPDGMDDVNSMWKLHGAEYLTEWLGEENGSAGKYTGLMGELLRLNTEVVLVRNGSYIYEAETGFIMSESQFRSVNYADRIYLEPKGDKLVEMKAASKWLAWPERRKVKDLLFKPGMEREREGEFINEWFDDSIEPADGDYSRLLQFIKDQVNDDLGYRHLMNMLAWHVQNPGKPPMNYMVLVSTVGHTGKSMLLDRLYRPIFGQWSWVLDEDTWNDANYTPWVRSQFVLYDEAFNGGSKISRKEESRLKRLSTANEVLYSDKYARKRQIDKGFMLAITTNNTDALAVGKFDRRAFVLGFGENPVKSYDAMCAEADWISQVWMRDGLGPARFKQALLDWDCSGFDHMADAPMTDAKATMQENALSAMELFVRDLSTNTDLLPKRYFTAKELGLLYVNGGGAGDEKAHSELALAKSISNVMGNWGYVRCKGSVRIGRIVGTYWDISGAKVEVTKDAVKAHLTNFTPTGKY